jgi:hypothetical protein
LERTDSRKAGEEFGILELVWPVQLKDEVDGRLARIDEVDDGRGMGGGFFRLELWEEIVRKGHLKRRNEDDIPCPC